MEQRSNRSRTLWLIVALALLAGAGAVGRQNRTAAAPLAPPPIDFAPAVNYNVGGGAKGLVTGDFNKDGWPDLAGVQWGAGRIFVQLNAGNGTFLPYSWYSPNNGGLWELATGDLNNDGNLDLVTANREFGAISVFLGTGSGTFTFLTSQGVGLEPTDVELGDFNKDDKLDLAIGYFDSSFIRVLLGVGNGTFNSGQTYLAGAGAAYLTIADFNADGILDLASANQNANTASVLLGNPGGTFAAGTNYPAGALTSSVTAGDIDGDGDIDLGVSNSNTPELNLYLNNGAGTFTLLNTIFGQSVGKMLFKDLNFDGALDIIVNNGISSTVPGSVSVNLGNGDGTFLAPMSWGAGVNPGSQVVADFNKDGLFDIAMGNYASLDGKDVSILYGRPVALPTATSTSTPTATATATSTATAIETATATATATETVTPTATLVPTSTATPPAATPTSPPGVKASALYLPLLANTRPRLLVAINPVAIATRPVAEVGEVYYTTAFTLSAPLPAGGRFYLSAAPDSVTPVLVDDELVVTVDGAEVYTRFLTYPRVVELPRSLLESWTGLTIRVVFRDAYGSVVGSTPVWLIWQP